ncbi:MAG TPA: alpha/beta fold hydrolase, partial [Gemmatimonadota bacterium]|nr:alpha/beta fold hydrolase [Gemmatimonadota bacterium]
MSPAAWIAGLVVALALAAALLWLAIGWLGHYRLNRPPRQTRPADFTFTPWETDAAHEIAEFETSDGVRLHGWFLRHEEESRVVVVMHGYRGEKSDVLGMSTALWRAGFDVLLFDFRGRGRSARAPITMGYWEVADLAAALDWVGERVPGARIGLLGFSMGGAVAILGGADERVRAIVADSVFGSQREVIEHAAERDARRFFRGWIPGSVFLPAMEWWHRRSGRPAFDEIAPVRRVPALADTPILFIHGTRDHWIPLDHARRLLESAPETSESWVVDDALHCGAYFLDRPGYCQRVA